MFLILMKTSFLSLKFFFHFFLKFDFCEIYFSHIAGVLHLDNQLFFKTRKFDFFQSF
jgi:hypothetical protein